MDATAGWAVSRLATRGVMVTAKADSTAYEFVSRYFATGAGIDEDPVPPTDAPTVFDRRKEAELRLQTVPLHMDRGKERLAEHLPGSTNAFSGAKQFRTKPVPSIAAAQAEELGELFNNEGPPELLDLNGDGTVDVRDATTYGDIWHGGGGSSQPWNGSTLPNRPE